MKELRVAFTKTADDYLEVLNCPEINVPLLENLRIEGNKRHNHTLTRLRGAVFYKFRSKLEKMTLGYVERSALSDFGGDLVQYLSNFKHMEDLDVIGMEVGLVVDIPRLVEECVKLKQVSIFGLCNIFTATRVMQDNNGP